MMLQVRKQFLSKIGVLPCLFVLVLWFLLPLPELQSLPPQIDAQTKTAAMKALEGNRLMLLHHRLKEQLISSQKSESDLFGQDETKLGRNLARGRWKLIQPI